MAGDTVTLTVPNRDPGMTKGTHHRDAEAQRREGIRRLADERQRPLQDGITLQSEWVDFPQGNCHVPTQRQGLYPWLGRAAPPGLLAEELFECCGISRVVAAQAT